MGELDMPDLRHGADVLAQQFRRARLVIIPGVGHLAPLEQPEPFCGLVLEHLREG